MPIFQLPKNDIYFPDPNLAENDGFLAVGGDLSPIRLLNAYANGIFHWFNPNDEILWWSTNPRLVLYPNDFIARKSLMQSIKNKGFIVKFDNDFETTINNCATARRKENLGTWISNEIKTSYLKLFEMGFAHSVEVYKDNIQVGGLYGVQIGTVFSGESMYSNIRDTSKIALYNLCQNANKFNIEIIDSQTVTKHMITLGAKKITRQEFLNFLRNSLENNGFIVKSWKQ
jgi:leucyl/phenylalanyl-tRNA--protein transferase